MIAQGYTRYTITNDSMICSYGGIDTQIALAATQKSFALLLVYKFPSPVINFLFLFLFFSCCCNTKTLVSIKKLTLYASFILSTKEKKGLERLYAVTLTLYYHTHWKWFSYTSGAYLRQKRIFEDKAENSVNSAPHFTP